MLREERALAKPASTMEAERRILTIKEEIDKVRSQLDDAGKRESMSQTEYCSWRRRALHSMRFMKSRIRRLEHLRRYNAWKDRTDFAEGIDIGRTLKLLAKQHGRLLNLLEAVEAYVDSPDEDSDDELFDKVVETARLARRSVGSRK